jgi:hypothetical protein
MWSKLKKGICMYYLGLLLLYIFLLLLLFLFLLLFRYNIFTIYLIFISIHIYIYITELCYRVSMFSSVFIRSTVCHPHTSSANLGSLVFVCLFVVACVVRFCVWFMFVLIIISLKFSCQSDCDAENVFQVSSYPGNCFRFFFWFFSNGMVMLWQREEG